MTNSTDMRVRIIDTALEIANSEGIDAVAIRSVAAELDVSPGHVSYYFPRRADLALALSERLSARNSPLGEKVVDGFADLLEGYYTTFRHQYEHRGIVVALPSLVEVHPEMRDQYRQTSRVRLDQQRTKLSRLRDLRHLDASDEQIDRLLAHIAFVARHWLAEFTTIHHEESTEAAIAHYVGLIADLVLPYATASGRYELAPYVDAILPLPTAEGVIASH